MIWLLYSLLGRETSGLSQRGGHGHAFCWMFVESPLKSCLLDQVKGFTVDSRLKYNTVDSR